MGSEKTGRPENPAYIDLEGRKPHIPHEFVEAGMINTRLRGSLSVETWRYGVSRYGRCRYGAGYWIYGRDYYGSFRYG